MTTTYLIKPIEATLSQDKAWHGRPDCYISAKVGGKKINSQIGKISAENNINWTDALVIPKTNETTIQVTLKDKAKFFGKKLCNFTLDLKAIEDNKYLAQWFPLTKKGKPAGQIYLKCELQVDGVSVYVPPEPENRIVYEQKYDEYGNRLHGEVEAVMISKEGVRSPVKPDATSNLTSVVLGGNQPPTTAGANIQQQIEVNAQSTYVPANQIVTTTTSQRPIQVVENVTYTENVHGLQPSEDVLTSTFLQEGARRVPAYEFSTKGASKGRLESVGVYHLRDDPNYQLTHAHEEYRVANAGTNGEDQKVVVDKFVEVKAVEEPQVKYGEVEADQPADLVRQESNPRKGIQVQDNEIQKLIDAQDRDVEIMIQAQNSEIQKMIEQSNADTQKMIQQANEGPGDVVVVERTVTTTYVPADQIDIKNQEVAGI